MRKFTWSDTKKFLITYWKQLTVAVTSVLIIIGWLQALDKVIELVSTLNPSDNIIAVLVLALVTFIILSLILAVFNFMSRHQPHNDEIFRKVQNEHNIFVENSLKVTNKLYPAEEHPPYYFEKVEVTLTMEKDGSASLRRLEHVRAHGKPLHFWEQCIHTEAEADEVEFMEDLKFSIQEHNEQHEVSYLLTNNMPHRKRIMVFHLPFVDPIEEQSRIIETNYYWPRMLRRILEKGNEDWEWILQSSREVPLFEFKFFYSPGIGRITCSLLKPPPKKSLEKVTPQEIKSEQNWPGWLYKAENAPASGFTYKFRLSLNLKP